MKFNKKLTVLTVALLAAAIIPEAAFAAQTVGDIARNLTSSTTDVTKAVGAISTACGFVMAFIGALKFKAHKDNPREVPISMPIVYLIVAALLLFLPTLITTTAVTVLGADAQSQGMNGSGMENAIKLK